MTAPKINVDSFWLPRQNSTIAPTIDGAWDAAMIVSIVFFVLVVGTMILFAVKYKRRSENDETSPIDHNFKVEVIWTVLPTIIVFFLFAIGLKGYIGSSVAPAESLEINVTAKMYMWQFTYPDGTVMVNELGIPKGRPVKLIMSSEDVLHSFFVPEFRVKQDVVPSMYTTLWFEAMHTGESVLECTEYCGVGHSDMLATVKVMEQSDFEKWLEGTDDPNVTPVDRGKKLFATRSCANCHSVDGTRVQGPTFLGLFGRSEELADGTKVTVDENYIRESLLSPQAKVVKGYPPTMPTFQGLLKDKDIEALIAYIKTVK